MVTFNPVEQVRATLWLCELSNAFWFDRDMMASGPIDAPEVMAAGAMKRVESDNEPDFIGVMYSRRDLQA